MYGFILAPVMTNMTCLGCWVVETEMKIKINYKGYVVKPHTPNDGKAAST